MENQITEEKNKQLEQRSRNNPYTLCDIQVLENFKNRIV